jgi:hypothetical protein
LSQISDSTAILMTAVLPLFGIGIVFLRRFMRSRAARPAEAARARTKSRSAAVQQPPSHEKIIADFRAFLKRRPSSPTKIEDASLLPYRKELIFDALLSAMKQPISAEMKSFLRIAAVSLVQFQYDVGNEALEMPDSEFEECPESGDEDKIRRFNEFDTLVQSDLRRVMERIATRASSPVN